MSGLLSRRRRRRPELPLVPLIDVLVMLVLFAFVTMRPNAQTLNITLPKISSAGKNDLKNGVTIAIEKDGTVFFNGKPMADDQLIPQLIAIHNQVGEETPIVIKGDEQSQLKRLAFVIDACNESGLHRFTLESR